MAEGRLEANEAELEFGGQRLGIPVTRQITVTNIGSLALTLVAADLVEENGAEGQTEFTLEPSGVIDEVLYPGAEKSFEVTHTPVDGLIDSGQIRFIHTGTGGLVTVDLLAEFKGNPDVQITETLAEDAPALGTFYVGTTAEFGETVSGTFWVRNQGSLDSVLSLTDIQILPNNVGFSLADDFDGPLPLGAWEAGLCENDPSEEVNCPPGGVSCLDFDGAAACAGDDDLPLYAFPITVQYSPVDAPANATLTLLHNSGGNEDTQSNIELTATAPGCPANATYEFGSSDPVCVCLENYYDINGDLENGPSDGCEYYCVFAGVEDEPDDDFEDRNCDGVDGNAAEAIFVATSGSDSNPGTRDAPRKNLPLAIDLAALLGKDIYVSEGEYYLPETLDLTEGVSIYGGYAHEDWARDDANLVQFDVDDQIAVQADDITLLTVVDRVSFQAVLAVDDGESSYGLFASHSSGVYLNRVSLIAAAGGDGEDADPYTGSNIQAASGGPGSVGESGVEHAGCCGDFYCVGCKCDDRPYGGQGGTSSCGSTGGTGGRPGRKSANGDSGECGKVDGVCAASGGPGAPNNKGDWNPDLQYCGESGTAGDPGSNGAPGAFGFAAAGYDPSHGEDGGDGSAGSGGGGGGGGGGGNDDCDSYGGGGGGGGGGGCGGLGGRGGSSAGGSFAAYLWDSNLTMVSCTLRTLGGGSGGNGSVGQLGGAPGGGGRVNTTSNKGSDYGGGADQDDGSNGARGGDGGAGGAGGAGGGGAGGPSVGVLLGNGSNPTLTDVVFDLDNGGNGGMSSENEGPNGIRSETYEP